MRSDVFRFDEEWAFPDASPEEVFDVLARGKLLPEWWKGAVRSRRQSSHGHAAPPLRRMTQAGLGVLGWRRGVSNLSSLKERSQIPPALGLVATGHFTAR